MTNIENGHAQQPGPSRSVQFWTRASSIYLGYKFTQAKAAFLRLQGRSDEEINDLLWLPHNKKAGQAMHDLCVDMRGFFLKAGQFIGARSDFVPEEVCVWLRRLQDRVPPMPAPQTEAVLKHELKLEDMRQVFEWIDLDQPLGSASIAQVHKAQLRRLPRQQHPLLAAVSWPFRWILGRTASQRGKSDISVMPKTAEQYSAALQDADGAVVAVKVQYPNALPLFTQDLKNLRSLASFLTRTEIAFDLVSACDELSSQVKLEFDFHREGSVLDSTADSLAHIRRRVAIPRTVRGMVTERVLVMNFLQGVPLTQLGAHTTGLSDAARRKAMKMIIGRASEAYGRMILETGLFQADAHPGNILVMKGGRVGILDFGQSKQLSDQDRRLVAMLVLAINRGRADAISEVLWHMGLETEVDDPVLRARMGVDMFDTRGKVDPFSPDAPIKQCAITAFPKQFFLVLRVVQLFRGLSSRMDVEFSTAAQWQPFAQRALRDIERRADRAPSPTAGAN